ncbi:Retrovirus-related Pol polyprotein from transposon TNT 1-94 [Gossypium australe]|uniref:Retrovirus-related Pol polyprotein from transposon TNT 1-94 n=1 Tax=Gossypium australe TaxID=47621 RepID=A0A5B6WZM6_9ROSI|nr:Retrovirus-related Pol polyprotein from transposon TNT 1-94 [Gossypium australe]
MSQATPFRSFLNEILGEFEILSWYHYLSKKVCFGYFEGNRDVRLLTCENTYVPNVELLADSFRILVIITRMQQYIFFDT